MDNDSSKNSKNFNIARILESVEGNMSRQSSILETLIDHSKRDHEQEQEEREDRKRESLYERIRSKKANDSSKNVNNSLMQIKEKGSEFFANVGSEFLGSIMANMVSGLKYAIIAGISIPILKGFLDNLTGGAFSQNLSNVLSSLGDWKQVFDVNQLSEAIDTATMTPEEIQEALASAGAAKNAAYGAMGTAAGLFLGGPMLALKMGTGAAIEEGFRQFSGIDISDQAARTISNLTGMEYNSKTAGAAAMVTSAGLGIGAFKVSGLFAKMAGRLLVTPWGMLATALGGAIAYGVYTGQRRYREYIAGIDEQIEIAKRALENGDTDTGGSASRIATRESDRRGQLGQTQTQLDESWSQRAEARLLNNQSIIDSEKHLDGTFDGIGDMQSNIMYLLNNLDKFPELSNRIQTQVLEFDRAIRQLDPSVLQPRNSDGYRRSLLDAIGGDLDTRKALDSILDETSMPAIQGPQPAPENEDPIAPARGSVDRRRRKLSGISENIRQESSAVMLMANMMPKISNSTGMNTTNITNEGATYITSTPVSEHRQSIFGGGSGHRRA